MTGVPCMLAICPSSRWTIHAAPSFETFAGVMPLSAEWRWLARLPPTSGKWRVVGAKAGDCAMATAVAAVVAATIVARQARRRRVVMPALLRRQRDFQVRDRRLPAQKPR